MISLNTIHIDPKHRGKGNGSKAFKAMTRWADKNHMPMMLYASHFEHGVENPRKANGKRNYLTTPELRKFYARHGFTMNNGDFNDTQIRYPRPSVARAAKIMKAASKLK